MAVTPSETEFIGLSRADAEALAKRLNVVLRDRTEPGWYTDDRRPDRINVWFDLDGRIGGAERY